jgi:long-subunit fatty acid transport protein
MRRCQTLTVVLAALLFSAPRAKGDGLVRDGIGAISTGRGGTNIAHSDNGAIILDNPAGMANLSVDGFYEVGIDTVITDLDYTDPDNPEVDGKFRPYPMPELAYIRRSDDCLWSYGIGVFAPAGFGAEYDMQHPVTGPSVYKSIGMLIKVLPAVAVRVTDRLSVGATFGVAISHAELEGPFTLQTGALMGVPTAFDLQATGATPVGSLGMQYRLTDRTTIGACYQEESRFELHGNVAANVFGLAPIPLFSRFDAQVDLTWPRSLGVGVKHDLSASQRVSADVIWYDWSGAFDQIDITLTNSSNPLFTALLGPTIRDTFPLNWKDTVSLRLGYEWEANCRDVWRAGYVFHDSPVPSSTLTPYVDGVLEHAFSAGYTRRCDRYLLNLAYQYSFGPERPVGDSALAGDDFSNSIFEAQAHWASASIVVPF